MTRGSKEWRTEQARLQDELNRCLSALAEISLGSGPEADISEAEHNERLKNIAVRLNRIYSDESFRHRYSDIIGVIHRYDRDKKLSTESKLDRANERGAFLQSSLRELLTHECDEDCAEDCPIKELRGRIGFEKLYDHVSLEAKRAGYDHTRATDIISKIKEAQKDLDEAKNLVEDARAKAAKASRQAKRLQAETVSILGVFSAIILAFNASVTFSTSSIAAVDATPPFNVAFIVAIVGLMLFNCLYGAFALIYRIIRPESSPDSLLAPTRVVGIELCTVSCSLFLGTLTYFHGHDVSILEFASLIIAVGVLLMGTFFISRPEMELGRGRKEGNAGRPHDKQMSSMSDNGEGVAGREIGSSHRSGQVH